jgi:hypothetical protein
VLAPTPLPSRVAPAAVAHSSCQLLVGGRRAEGVPRWNGRPEIPGGM